MTQYPRTTPLYIDLVEQTEVEQQYNELLPVHTNYSSVEFNGINAYAYTPYGSGFSPMVGIDLDVLVYSPQAYTSISGYTIFDNYSLYKTAGSTGRNGTKISINSANQLVVTVGIDKLTYSNTYNFIPYLNKRTRITIYQEETSTRYYFYWYINGISVRSDIVSSLNIVPNMYNKRLSFGAEVISSSYLTNSPMYTNFCKMRLFGCSVLDGSSKTLGSKTNENLPINYAKDKLVFDCDENFGTKLINKVYRQTTMSGAQLDYFNNINMLLMDGTSWNLYLVDKSQYSVPKMATLNLTTNSSRF
jgi:hypothetical protein